MNSHLPQLRRDTQSYPHHTAAGAAPKSQARVLVGENNDRHRQNLKELLDLYGISVLEAENGEEVIEVTLQKRPDLILLNTELPKLDGFEATRAIRNIKSLDNIPIIFLCAETERIFRKHAFEVGGDSFHIAPLNLERLDYILEHFLFRID